MKSKRIVAALLAFAITAGIVGNAYAQNTGQAMTAESETAVSGEMQAEAEVSNPEHEQESENEIVRTELTEQNLPDVIDAETVIADGYVARLNSEEQSLSEVVLEKDDGTRALYLFSENVKYIDENGEVADKSNNAVRKGRAFVNEGNDVEIILPATLTAGIAVNSDELNITMKPLTDSIGRSLSTAVQTEEDTVLYSDVFDSSTDIEYTYTYSGVKENIILESYNGKNSFDYEVSTGGLSLYEDKGTLLLANENGEVKATLGEVIVFSADNKNNTFGKYTIKELEKNSRYKVTVSVDREYLTDSKTKYPVKIDPDLKTINASAKIQDLQVFKGTDGKGTSETSAGYSGVSRVGWTDWGACRTLLKLNGFSFSSYGIIDESQLKSAYVELRDLMCQGGSGVPISCGQFNGNYWNEDYTKTWNELNAGNSSLGSPVSVTYGNGNSQRKLSDKDQWYNWNVTGVVKKWINDISLKEKGLQFRTYTSFLEENSAYSDYMKTFSSMQGNASYKPYFCIKYNHKMVYNAITKLGNEDESVAKKTVSIFNSMGYPSTLYLKPTVEQIYKNANSSNVLVFHGHGSPGHIKIEQSQGGTILIYSNNATNSLHNIPASTWSHISFVYFATCKSATKDSENGRNSMVDEAYKLGADCVIGFKNEVSGAEDFLNYMANAINESSTPLTIDEAVSIAMSEYSNSERKEEDCPANPKNLYIVGNKSICLKK